MAVRIRLRRTGARHNPHYRLVAADARSPRDGRFLEILGHYHPVQEEIVVNSERTIHWLSKGAQPSETARSLLKKTGVWREWQASKQPKQTVEDSVASEE